MRLPPQFMTAKTTAGNLTLLAMEVNAACRLMKVEDVRTSYQAMFPLEAEILNAFAWGVIIGETVGVVHHHAGLHDRVAIARLHRSMRGEQ